MSGILHFLIGLVAIRLAMGGQGQADVSGAVEAARQQPAGPMLLWSSFAACVALAIWQTSDAIFDFEHLPTKKKVGKKLKAALQAVVYAGFALTLASVAIGAHADHRASTSDLTVKLMKAPGGVAAADRHRRRNSRHRGSSTPSGASGSPSSSTCGCRPRTARTAVTVIGIVGYAAKGVALLLMGLLIIIATMKADPEESTGLDGSLKALREQPFGVYMLAAVGAGLICYGIFMAVRAKLAKM